MLIIGGFALEVVRLGGAWISFAAGGRAMAERDVPRAISHYERALAWDPGKALYHSSLGAGHFTLFEQSRSVEAARAALVELEMAASLNPADGRLAARLGHVYGSLASAATSIEGASATHRERRTSWLRAARAGYRRALDLEPFSPFYRLDLARISLALGDRHDAEALAREAVDLEPNFLPGRLWLAHLYVASARTEDAQREYGEILARRQRYAGWTQNAVEERFLTVDVAPLEAALKKGEAAT